MMRSRPMRWTLIAALAVPVAAALLLRRESVSGAQFHRDSTPVELVPVILDDEPQPARHRATGSPVTLSAGIEELPETPVPRRQQPRTFRQPPQRAPWGHTADANRPGGRQPGSGYTNIERFPNERRDQVSTGQAAPYSGFQPWWTEGVAMNMRARTAPFQVNVEDLVELALKHSPHIQVIAAEPWIQQTYICEEVARFDWTTFLQSRWDDLSDPVGNTLTTGGSPRFRDHNLSVEGGFRNRTQTGGRFEIANRVGFQDNNSRFFVPGQQGTSRLELSFTQPLLARSGEFYNQSRIVLAQMDTNIAHDEYAGKLQEHLLKVATAYWELYRARAVLLQKQQSLISARKIAATLEARRDLDAAQRQILRAQAAVARRRSEIARAETSVRNAESQLRLLVNNPEWLDAHRVELIPLQTPPLFSVPISLESELQTAMQKRPDIHQAIRETKAATVRLGVAENEVLPRLDLFLSTYLMGLSGNFDAGRAYNRWFTQGEPGYSIGLTFEIPLGNRAARARANRRRWETQRAMNRFHAAVQTGMTEVELAVREVTTTEKEMAGRYQSMRTADAESKYLYERWKNALGGPRSTTLLLEDLLDSQERLADEEGAFVAAQVGYALALVDLKRTTGTLLQFSPAGGSPTAPTAPPASGGRTTVPPAPTERRIVPPAPAGPRIIPPSPKR